MTHSQKIQRLVVAGCVLLALLTGIIALVWWTDQRRSPSARPATIHSLRIERPGFVDITLRKQADEQWHIEEPCELQTNSQRLQPLLDALTPSAHSYASTDVDLEAAGLIRPEALIFVDEQRLALGASDLSGERRYLQRGDRVEFVPEWILSLLNGGLSAIAVADVFPQGLDALRAAPPQTDGDTGKEEDVSDESLQRWRTLSAQQIVSWPLNEVEEPIATRQWLADIAGQQTGLTLQDFQRFIALRFENAGCAYILPRSSLPDSVFP